LGGDCSCFPCAPIFPGIRRLVRPAHTMSTQGVAWNRLFQSHTPHFSGVVLSMAQAKSPAMLRGVWCATETVHFAVAQSSVSCRVCDSDSDVCSNAIPRKEPLFTLLACLDSMSDASPHQMPWKCSHTSLVTLWQSPLGQMHEKPPC